MRKTIYAILAVVLLMAMFPSTAIADDDCCDWDDEEFVVWVPVVVGEAWEFDDDDFDFDNDFDFDFDEDEDDDCDFDFDSEAGDFDFDCD